MSNHALVFKVLRVRPPDPSIPDQINSSIKDGSSAAHFPDHPLGASAFGDQINIKGEGQLAFNKSTQNFGTTYLGQTLTVVVALVNQSDFEVNNVGIRVEVQSDHGKSLLLDTMPTQGLASLAPGQHHEFKVKHDIRNLGPHTLLCASAYVTPASPNEPKYSPQAFKFQVLNPLIVRTKHRALGSSTVFLEATIENKTEDPMKLESVDLAVAAGYAAQRILISSSNGDASNSSLSDMDPLGENNSTSAPILPPRGGAAGYIFKLTRLWQQPPQQPKAGTSPRAAAASNQDGSALGKLDIKWKGSMGDLARLQTQIISGLPKPHRELRLKVKKFPERLVVAKPFPLEISILSGVDRRLGPLKVSYHPAYAMKSSSSAPLGGTTISTAAAAATTTRTTAAAVGVSSEEGIVLEGLQSECIHAVEPRGTAQLTLSMLPRLPGRQYIQGLILTDDRDGKVLDTVAPIEVYVEENDFS